MQNGRIGMKQQKLKEKLDEIVSYYDEFLEDFPKESVFEEERLVRRGIEKTVELMADAIIDAAMTLISMDNMNKPKDSREAIRLLEEKGVLSRKTSLKVQDFISFRNLLVHRYARIDESKEYQSLSTEHQDIIAFVKEVETYLKRKKS